MPDQGELNPFVRLLCAASLAVLAACGGGGDDGGGGGGGGNWSPGVFPPSSTFAARCVNPRSGTNDLQGTVLDENNFLRSYSDETYLWYDEIVDQNPANFSSPLAYFDELRTFATTPSGADKDRFHFTFPTDEWERLSGAGEAAGYGAQWAILAAVPPRDVRVAYTEPDSPATATGVNLARGAEVLFVDGINVANSNNANALNAAFFPSSAGESHTFTVRDVGSSNTRDVTMVSEIVTSTPVQNVKAVATPMGNVGYLTFNDHIAPAEAQLVAAVEQLAAQNAQHLVLDLRYNGGGFLAIASQLAYMIAGDVPTAGAIFEEIRFNEKHPTTDPVTKEPLVPMPFFDTTLGFSGPSGQPLPALDLQTVYVLTGPDTCSASESIINSLRGVDVEVVLVGSTTCGKPFGFYPTDNCGTTYFTIQFQGFNNKGFGDYGDGFSPQNDAFGVSVPGCSVHDDFEHALGDPLEARFKTALDLIQGGSCPAPTGAAPERGLAKPGALAPPDGITPKGPWRENRILKP